MIFSGSEGTLDCISYHLFIVLSCKIPGFSNKYKITWELLSFWQIHLMDQPLEQDANMHIMN